MQSELRHIAPGDCTFVFCLPLDRAAFRRTAANPASYAAQYKGGWYQYEELFGKGAAKSLREYKRLGVEVLEGATGKAFGELFLGNRRKVIVLFSHWHTTGVEFADRFWNDAELTDLLPANANGILDLCVCHPLELVRRVARERKGVRMCWTDERRTPLLWFQFYDSLFRVLSKGNYSYIEAFGETAAAYIEVFRGGALNREPVWQQN
jgi:hypothetical protein